MRRRFFCARSAGEKRGGPGWFGVSPNRPGPPGQVMGPGLPYHFWSGPPFFQFIDSGLLILLFIQNQGQESYF
ncbi:MAG: hypothetical protein CVT93_06855 [Bacteroidetes bacterium HGW-Bacteroidetes-10]|nr:MAG: hypothetical protein CVT93_06855 [Bacteroidetes bacterium HGW-Bacteroidetes-10]